MATDDAMRSQPGLPRSTGGSASQAGLWEDPANAGLKSSRMVCHDTSPKADIMELVH